MPEFPEDLMDYDELEPDELEENYNIEYSLTSYGIDFDVTGLVRRFNAKTVFAPEFQRSFVWNIRKASKFIESLLLGLPVPGIFLLKEDESQKFLIIDGLQRLTSLASYFNNDFLGKKFRLSGVSNAFNGKTINDLPSELKMKLEDTVIHSTVIKADDPIEKNYSSVYLIFERLNTGGMNLSPQEIRNCIYQGEFLKLIIELANNEKFLDILRIDKKRKKHEEICLRLIALSLDYENYTGNMKQFLNNFIDYNKNFEKYSYDMIYTSFISVIDVISNHIDNNVFRPNKGPINLAILDSVYAGLSHLYLNGKKINVGNISDKLLSIIQSTEFQKTIMTGKTHHTESIKNRIRIIIRSLE
ncbi:hypothetical protein B4O97_17905 [Marispirochaeta aestuarii]|uniref:GmrSD restriction endonucleases N-terminal domain-containing protein n=1 Tax=Marispirochaeta aestuarii TaxID=1963862 RepID=A0A1Y1RTA7_9SPIO|nr:DUF262 domain-containing protein [Marispirochaeta aestuarii]ORC30661.1 hypothetical protein B4O97_17905 [Marispirochaeta aestuarii]